MTDTDVIIVGAGPAGLMLASELRLAGARPLVLERQPHLGEAPKANGLGGQILQLLRYRGLLDRFEAASTNPHPTPIFPFGGVHLDFTHLADHRSRPWRSRSRGLSVCSMNAPPSSVPRCAADMRCSR